MLLQKQSKMTYSSSKISGLSLWRQLDNWSFWGMLEHLHILLQDYGRLSKESPGNSSGKFAVFSPRVGKMWWNKINSAERYRQSEDACLTGSRRSLCLFQPLASWAELDKRLWGAWNPAILKVTGFFSSIKLQKPSESPHLGRLPIHPPSKYLEKTSTSVCRPKRLIS